MPQPSIFPRESPKGTYTWIASISIWAQDPYSNCGVVQASASSLVYVDLPGLIITRCIALGPDLLCTDWASSQQWTLLDAYATIDCKWILLRLVSGGSLLLLELLVILVLVVLSVL
jgi:hypothetical protein